MIDVNVSLSRWPFRRLAGDEPRDLVARLHKRNVSQAWTGSFDGIFHKDISAANARLANDCRTYGAGFLLPFGSVNPKLPDWQEDLRRCHEEHKMPGIRLHPNYHGYKLDDPVCGELLRAASLRSMIVQLNAAMEDERTQHPLMRVPPVDIAPLPELARSNGQLRLVLLNSYFTANIDKTLQALAAAGNVHFDFAMAERIGAVSRLAGLVSFSRLLFGSNSPLFYFESALLKVKESGLTPEQSDAVLTGNATRLITGHGSRHP
jgi:uncharacterized protein